MVIFEFQILPIGVIRLLIVNNSIFEYYRILCYFQVYDNFHNTLITEFSIINEFSKIILLDYI